MARAPTSIKQEPKLVHMGRLPTVPDRVVPEKRGLTLHKRSSHSNGHVSHGG